MPLKRRCSGFSAAEHRHAITIYQAAPELLKANLDTVSGPCRNHVPGRRKFRAHGTRKDQRHTLCDHAIIQLSPEIIAPAVFLATLRKVPTQEIKRNPASAFDPHLGPIMKRWRELIQQVSAQQSRRNTARSAHRYKKRGAQLTIVPTRIQNP